MTKYVCVTQEPHGSYHLVDLVKQGVELIHLVPDGLYDFSQNQKSTGPLTPLAYRDQDPSVSLVRRTSDSSVIAQADALLVSGGLLTDFSNSAMEYARSIGKPIYFLELAYPSGHNPVEPRVAPDVVFATTDAGARHLESYFGGVSSGVRVLRADHPSLQNLPRWSPAPVSTLLICTSVYQELPDFGQTLLAMAQEAQRSWQWQVEVRPHPREDLSMWSEFSLSTGKTLSESLVSAWAVLGYQTTAFLTSNRMGVPSYHVATEPWMTSLVPEGYAYSRGVHSSYQIPNEITPPDFGNNIPPVALSDILKSI